MHPSASLRRLLPSLLAVATAITALPLAAQSVNQAPGTLRCDSCGIKRPGAAVLTATALNILVNRADLYVGRQDWADVFFSHWRRNLKLGWEWDENGFVVNMFAHPYHGGLYFNSGRANGLSYWESVPIAFMGSFMWEYFGERHRPSLNDFFNTSFGGIALGEVFHRAASSIRDNTASGGERRLRELAALPLDPVGSFERIVRGEWSSVGENPREHNPGAFVFRIASGARLAAVDTGNVDELRSGPSLVLQLDYGDQFDTRFRAAFDVFKLRAQIAPGGGGLNLLRASGRIFAFDLNDSTARHRQQFFVNQRFDYVKNPAHKFGAQSVEGGIASRWRLTKGFAIRTEAAADAIILGALDAPKTGAGERTYDFGPGGGIRLDASLERNGVTYVSLLNRTEFVHSISGASANHFVEAGGLEAVLPIGRGLGLGMHALYYNRLSNYSDAEEQRKEYPEVRLLLIWTRAGNPALARTR